MTIPRLFPSFDPPPEPDLIDAQALRTQVRSFVVRVIERGTIIPGRQTWTTWSRDFSRRCAEAGYIAMTLPPRYGGHGRSAFERYVVCEELLAAGAPQSSHWIADRQSGQQILRHGAERLKEEIRPRIAAGTCTFGIGMSEPDSGSDLSSIRTPADKVEGGYHLYGQKIWTTNAQHTDYMIVLCRTAPRGEVELNEVTFDGAFVPADHLLGTEGDGWQLVGEELAFERSGPDRTGQDLIYLWTFVYKCAACRRSPRPFGLSRSRPPDRTSDVDPSIVADNQTPSHCRTRCQRACSHYEEHGHRAGTGHPRSGPPLCRSDPVN